MAHEERDVRRRGLNGAWECSRGPQIVAPHVLPRGIVALDGAIAVGTVKNTLTRCCEITRQHASGSDVPTGLPSYSTVVLPLKSGSYTI